jgi:hypothetical protein
MKITGAEIQLIKTACSVVFQAVKDKTRVTQYNSLKTNYMTDHPASFAPRQFKKQSTYLNDLKTEKTRKCPQKI